MNIRNSTLVVGAVALLSVAACKGSPASPFDRLQDTPITVYRLQNFEQPAAATPTPTPAAPGGLAIPGLPAEIQTWVQQGAQGMGGLLPGLGGLIPGLGGTAAQPAATPAPDAPRFEGFRIINQSQVMDAKMRTELIEILGYESSFETKKSACLYPEMGVSFQQGGTPANVLVSFSCSQVQARNFQWPFANNGLKEDTVKRFHRLNQSLFGGGG